MIVPWQRRDVIATSIILSNQFLTQNFKTYETLSIFQTMPHLKTSSALVETAPSPLEQMIAEEGISLRDLEKSSFRTIRDAMGDAQVILIGEATHGTEEFYNIRAELTKILLEQEGFDAVLCEGDFPPFFELNRYVGGAPPYRDLPHSLESTEKSLRDSFSGFGDRFPGWMWQNNVMMDFVQWLREFNLERDKDKPPVQLLGLDIYSLFRSTDEVIRYLTEAGEFELVKEARRRYAVLDCFRPNASEYTEALYADAIESQSHNVTKMLTKLYQEERRLSQIHGDGQELFNALQNARVVTSAESYYSHSFMGRNTTWNIRDSAFVDMIKETIAFVEQQKRQKGSDTRRARVVVWAHNSHVGDALATATSKRGQHNVGQLCREAFGKENVYIVGFSTHDGTVRAAKSWGAAESVMNLNPSFESSVESLLHAVAKKRRQNAFGYVLRSNAAHIPPLVDEAAQEVLAAPLIQRFVGVCYIRSNELRSHYYICCMSNQYDFLIHVDRSSALRIDRTNHHENKPRNKSVSATKRHDLFSRAKLALMPIKGG